MIADFAGGIKGYGSGAVLGAVRFVPGATPTIQHRFGVKSVARNGGAGLYRITLTGKHQGFIAVVSYNENDTTLYHFVRVEAIDESASTIDISHKSCAFANVATGPAASDTVDSITVVFYAVGY
jgi:hypothetical protein